MAGLPAALQHKKFSSAEEFALRACATKDRYFRYGCCQTNDCKHQIDGAIEIYTLSSCRHSAIAAARFSLKLMREERWRSLLKWF